MLVSTYNNARMEDKPWWGNVKKEAWRRTTAAKSGVTGYRNAISEILAENNGRTTDLDIIVEFDSEQDYTMFMLRWT
jgi:hypothetical protein